MTDAKRYAVTVEDYYRYGEEDRRYTHSVSMANYYSAAWRRQSAVL